MAAIRTHEGRMTMAQELGQKMADFRTQSEVELNKIIGAVGVLGQATHCLEAHKDFWKEDFRAQKFERDVLDYALEAIDNCCGILRNLETEARVTMQREHGKLEAMVVLMAQAESLAKREAGFLLDAASEGDAAPAQNPDAPEVAPVDEDGEPIIHTGVVGRPTVAQRRAEEVEGQDAQEASPEVVEAKSVETQAMEATFEELARSTKEGDQKAPPVSDQDNDEAEPEDDEDD